MLPPPLNATILAFFKEKLHEINHANTRIANYFNVIVGTNICGLVTTMLTTANKKGNPHFAAKDITNFYL
ncbi:hypothetical protein EJB05_48676, partial [Eragrostis curvula]